MSVSSDANRHQIPVHLYTSGPFVDSSNSITVPVHRGDCLLITIDNPAFNSWYKTVSVSIYGENTVINPAYADEFKTTEKSMTCVYTLETLWINQKVSSEDVDVYIDESTWCFPYQWYFKESFWLIHLVPAED